MERILSDKANEKLRRRAPLPVDATRSIAIKRDVHEFIVDVPAETFARSFRAVVTDPEGTFGLIRVKRPAHRMGRDFEVGERFQGCFSLELAMGNPWILRTRLGRAFTNFVEDQMLSDYAEVVDIREEMPNFRLEYRYLDGTPIAGRSIFTIEPHARGCVVRQIFEYQEVNGIALGTFQRFGLKMHDQVVQMEIVRAAEHAGGRVVEATIPEEYA